MGEILDVVNERDEVIGQIDREAHHNSEAIVRMVFVGFYTPERSLILQRRSRSKRSSPGKLTSTVSGHVSAGQTYLEAAIRETEEETGVKVAPEQLTDLGVQLGGHAMRAIYAYEFSGSLKDLKIEPDEGDGFVTMSTDALLHDRTIKPRKYTPFILGDGGSTLISYVEHV